MKIILLLLGMSTTISGYVLLQVRKGDNQSNVDALIHKVLPTRVARKNYDSKRDELESIVVAIESGSPWDDKTADRRMSTTISGYVLLQVRKGDNQSNVDALIHKVLPTRMAARKNYDSKRDELESIVVAIDSGSPSNDKTTGAFDRVIRKLSKVLQTKAMKIIPKYRSKLEQMHIKPEIVHFKSGKPSVMFEINTKELAKSIQQFLSSNDVKKYAEKVAGKAAVLYRTFKEEFMKDE